MSNLTQVSDLKVGMVLETPGRQLGYGFSPNSVIQIVEIGPIFFRYFYLETDLFTKFVPCFYKSVRYALLCEEITDYPAHLLCEDCSEFCNQKCLRIK